jgi:nitrogen-specific signal transduction histidine kinase/ActR/RegA family two-component response regulator
MVHEPRQKHRKVRAKGVPGRKRSGVTKRHKEAVKTRLLHEKLALFSRVASFGELTAWLAHELNQPLASILGNAQAALQLMDRGTLDPDEFRGIFHDIVTDDRRATEMVRSMRSKFKRGVTERNPLLLNDLIKEIIPIVRNDALARNVSIDLDLGLSLPSITGDRIRLQLTIFNLIVNAFEAMNASERPGKLILRTRHAGGEIVLDVVDSGAGIPHEQINSIFEPLVTTKADALGMGLSLSRSIVISHNGRLWAENNIDGGATFHVALPVENRLTLAPTAGVDRSSHGGSGRRSRGLTILIADDGETFRRAISSILTELPELKHLAEAADGAEAIKMAAELNPDLVLLDVGLPIANGVEAAAKIRIVAPNAKLLFLTQHESPDFVDAALRAGALGYVLKVDAGSELLEAAMAVIRGEQYISSGIRRRQSGNAE